MQDLLLHRTSVLQPTSIGFLKIDALQDVRCLLRRNRFYHSWTAVGRGAIRLKRNYWREMEELNLQRWSSNCSV